MRGSVVHEVINGQLTGIEHMHDSLESQIALAKEALGKAELAREEAYIKIGDRHVPEFKTKGLAKAYSDIKSAVQHLGRDRDERETHLVALRESTQEHRQALISHINAVTIDLEARITGRDERIAAVRDSLASNREYQTHLRSAQDLQSRITRAEEAFAEAERRREKEGRVYERSLPFLYLRKRKFSTKDYRAGTLTRFDNWLAPRINYTQTKENYERLLAAPGQMKIRLEKHQAELETIENALAAIETATADKADLSGALRTLDIVQARREGYVADLQHAEARRAELSAELATLRASRDTYHQKALGYLRSHLTPHTIKKLRETALASPDPQDRTLLDVITRAEETIQTTTSTLERLRKQHDLVTGQREGLRSIETAFSRRGYNSTHSQFPDDFNVNTLLLSYLAGQMNVGDVTHNLSRSHTKDKPAPYSATSKDYRANTSRVFSAGNGI